ncbi:MAG TPA: hypothetical protein VLB80_03515 [Candidatus Babeliales bacterium]|nr:hypothetical protein [Candidatus Babeliales bacterium]
MRNRIYIFGIGLLFSYNISISYSYHLCVVRNVTNTNNNQQLIICVGDYHFKNHPANKSQRIYIESLLQKYSRKSKLVVEDVGSINNDGRMVCCNFGINCPNGLLGQLANTARSLGVVVDNVEYRYCRVAGVGPLLNNINVNPHSFRSSATISTLALHKEVSDEIEKIKKYDDGKFLNGLYKRTVAAVHAALLKIDFNKKLTVADYCLQLPHKDYRIQLETLCIFDSALIDMNIMHSIIACSEVPLIFVVAGGSHIEHVSSLLMRMGCDVLFTTTAPSLPAIRKVLNSGSAADSSDIYPAAIDISIIDKFIR